MHLLTLVLLNILQQLKSKIKKQIKFGLHDDEKSGDKKNK